jgi:hypothetical protein
MSAVRGTASNPAVLDAFVLAMIAGGGPPAYPDLPGHEPDLDGRDSRRARSATPPKS